MLFVLLEVPNGVANCHPAREPESPQLVVRGFHERNFTAIPTREENKPLANLGHTKVCRIVKCERDLISRILQQLQDVEQCTPWVLLV